MHSLLTCLRASTSQLGSTVDTVLVGSKGQPGSYGATPLCRDPLSHCLRRCLLGSVHRLPAAGRDQLSGAAPLAAPVRPGCPRGAAPHRPRRRPGPVPAGPDPAALAAAALGAGGAGCPAHAAGRLGRGRLGRQRCPCRLGSPWRQVPLVPLPRDYAGGWRPATGAPAAQGRQAALGTSRPPSRQRVGQARDAFLEVWADFGADRGPQTARSATIGAGQGFRTHVCGKVGVCRSDCALRRRRGSFVSGVARGPGTPAAREPTSLEQAMCRFVHGGGPVVN
jgi:hypothetical protein